MLVLVLWLDYVDVCGGGVLDYVVTGFGYSVIGRGGEGRGKDGGKGSRPSVSGDLV